MQLRRQRGIQSPRGGGEERRPRAARAGLKMAGSGDHRNRLDGFGPRDLQRDGARGRGPLLRNRPDPDPQGGDRREGHGRLPALFARGLHQRGAVQPDRLGRDGIPGAGARERGRALRVPAADREAARALVLARGSPHVAHPPRQAGGLGGLQARRQPRTRAGDPCVRRPGPPEAGPQGEGRRHADPVPRCVHGRDAGAVDPDRASPGGARDCRRGARHEGRRNEICRARLAHDGTPGGEPPSRDARGTLLDGAGVHGPGDEDSPERPSARGRSRPGRTSDGCRSAGARRARGLVHPRGSSWLSFARPSHIPLNTAPAVPSKFRVEAIAANSTLTAIRGVRVGHAQDIRRRTGTTVVLLEPPAMAFADARGGWPGTYDTAASDLGKTFIERHALLLTGGDVYGFDAVRGIRRFLLEHKLASPKGGGAMPAIMGTNIYDLEFAHTDGLDYTEFGYERSEEHTSELQSPCNLVCRLLLEKKKI